MKPEPALKRIDASDMPEDIASAWEASMALRGDATFFEVFANHPDLYRWYVGSFYGDVFRGGTVAQSYKELLRLRLSTLHGCRFCNQGNRRDALAAGLTEEQINNIANRIDYTNISRRIKEKYDKIDRELNSIKKEYKNLPPCEERYFF